MHLKDHNIVIPIVLGPSNPPIVWNPFVSVEKQREIGLNFVSNLEFCDLPGMFSMFHVPSPLSMGNTFHHNSWEGVWLDLICPCVGTTENTNLSGPQKELSTWHWKLGIGMQRNQEMMWETMAIDDDGKELILPPVITPTFSSTPHCPTPMCHSCDLA